MIRFDECQQRQWIIQNNYFFAGHFGVVEIFVATLVKIFLEENLYAQRKKWI